ncbi:unnamed protein product [Closterium sp. NIES-53]
MASRVLVPGLPRSLPPLPPGPAPTCVPCVEGRQRAAPHSSEFPPTEAPLQTLHMDVWGPARVRGQGHERYFLLVVDDYSRYTTVFPLRSKGEVTEVMIDWIRAARLQLRERFSSDFPVLRLHSDRGGEFSSDLLRAFCHAEGIRQTFTLPASPHQNGIAERRIGMVMDVARMSMIHVAAPHFLWPFVVQYAAHQINLQPRVSLPETSPTLQWMGKVGDASAFRVWGSRAFVRDLSADKLSSRAVPCVFLGFPPDAPGWQFYHPTSRRVLSSQDVTFDESVPYYHAVELVEVAVDSGGSGGAEPERAEPGGAGSRGAEPERAEPWGAASGGARSGGAEPERAEPGGAASGGAEPARAETRGAEPGVAESGGAEHAGAGPGGPSAGVCGQGHKRYFLLVVDDYLRYTTVFPLRSKGEVTEVMIDWIRVARLQLRERFGSDFPVLRLHSDRGGEFSSDIQRAFCRAEGIRQTFTLPASPQKDGIAERRIGMVMDVARTSMIHVAAPHFLWPFAVQYAMHQINLQPRVSLPETSPTLRWTGKFYHPTSRRVLSSQDVTFDESVPYYRLFPYRTAPLPPPPLFLAPGPPPVDPLPPQGPSPSGVSQVDAVEPVEVAADSGASRGTEPGCAESGGAAPGGAEPGGAVSGGAEPGGAEPGGAGSGGAEPERAEPWGAASGGADPGAAGSGGVEPAGAGPGGPSGALSRRELPSPQELREWFGRRWSRAAGAGGVPSAGGSTATGGAGAGGSTGAGLGGSTSAGGARAAGPGGSRTGGPGAAGPAGAPSAGAGGAAGVGATGGTGAEAAVSAGGPTRAGAAGGTNAGGAAGVGADAGGAGVVPAGFGGAARPRPYLVPLLEQVLGLPPSSGPAPSLECPPPGQSDSQLHLASPLPAPSPYAGPIGSLAERHEHESRPASPVCTARTSRRVPRPLPPVVLGTHQMTLRPSTAPQRVPLPSPPASSLPALADPASDSLRAATPTVMRLLATAVTDPSFESTAAPALVTELVDFAAHCRLDFATSLVAESASVCPPSVGGECALSTDVLEDRQEEFQCFAPALPHLVSTLLAPQGDPDAPDIPTPRSYAEAIEGTYVDNVPPPGVNIVSGMWIFMVKRPPGSPPVFKARYVARGFSQQQGVDYFQTFSPTPKMTTLRGSLHEEIWLRRPPGFTGSFPPGTQWSLRRLVYGLRQAPREWHDTLRTTLAALGFAPSTADPSLFLRTDTLLLPFYILVYVDDLVFATADTAGLAHVLQRFDFTYSSPQATPLSTRHSLSALPSDESVELSGPYPELVGCLMYLMTCTRPDLAYPLSILACYVAPGRHRPEHMAAAKRVLRYLCSTSGLGLVLGWQSPVVLTGHADASSCEAEIYAGAMAAQELRWLTYLLTDLGEPPRSPPVLYVDNKAMLALCREHRLEHRMKHIAFRYFLARELQLRGQLRLAYVASQANIADIFTKALQPCDHQRFCNMLACFALLCLTSRVTPSSPPLCL